MRTKFLTERGRLHDRNGEVASLEFDPRHLAPPLDERQPQHGAVEIDRGIEVARRHGYEINPSHERCGYWPIGHSQPPEYVAGRSPRRTTISAKSLAPLRFGAAWAASLLAQGASRGGMCDCVERGSRWLRETTRTSEVCRHFRAVLRLSMAL